jgi:hypothetical protein
LAGRFLSETAESIGTFFFDSMCKFQAPATMAYQGPEALTMASWAGQVDPDGFSLALDQASVRPLSEAVIRKLTPDLMKAGVIGTERGLRTLGYPDADNVASEQQTQMALQALAKVRSGKK